MTAYPTQTCVELEEEVTHYAYEAAISEEERQRVEEHLKACPSCGELIFFIRKTRELARKNPIHFEPASEPCPSAESIVALEEGTLDTVTSRKVGVHLLHCKQCREDYLMLRGLSEEKFEEEILEKLESHGIAWRQLLERIETYVLDLGKTYGPGAMLGYIRIACEQPAFAAVRGERGPRPLSKVIEVSLGKNTYGIELGLRADGSLACDIAGYTTPRETPCGIAISSEDGELFSTETDAHGNAHFTLGKQHISRAINVLTLRLESDERHIPFSLPQLTTA